VPGYGPDDPVDVEAGGLLVCARAPLSVSGSNAGLAGTIWHRASVILREPVNSLDPRMRTYWRVESLLAVAFVAALVVAGAVTAAALGAETAAWLVGAIGGLAVLVLGVVAVATASLDYRHFRYEVTQLGLYVAKGWLWQRREVVPHARVQTVDTTAGPLLRAFGLVAVEVRTASAAGSTSIPGLAPQVADELVEELARRAELEEGT
jgi:uncharacterized protein